MCFPAVSTLMSVRAQLFLMSLINEYTFYRWQRLQRLSPSDEHKAATHTHILSVDSYGNYTILYFKKHFRHNCLLVKLAITDNRRLTTCLSPTEINILYIYNFMAYKMKRIMEMSRNVENLKF